MTKFNLNGKSIAMVLSFFAFMILGSVNASAQWVSSSEAVLLLKGQLTTLENDFAQATTNEQKVEIAFETRYYTTVFTQITEGGLEVSEAVEAARPTTKPSIHSSGLIAFSTEFPDFKMQTQALVDAGTDLLSN